MKDKQANSAGSLPTGTLTFLLTDLEGSTQLWESHHDKFKLVLARHDVIIETTVAQHGGLIVKPRGEGDSRFAVFVRPTSALLAADQIQQTLAQEIWNIPDPVRVRIALHSGEADLRDSDYYGPTVNRCARLRSVGHGGQTLVTQATYSLVYESLPEELSFRYLGKHKLKDIKQPERIYQLISPGLPADFPPLRTQNNLIQNMPVNLTSFIGREKEIEDLTYLLNKQRLLTISGPGGAGKTRLALQASSVSMNHFLDGGWFIDLSLISNPSLVIQFVMKTLGIQEDGYCSPMERLLYFFQDKSILLILDNCEHVLPGVTPLTQTLLGGTTSLTILATSREPLGVAGETVWNITPLSTPKIGTEFSIETLLQYEAVVLFVERAKAARSDFLLTNNNAQAIAQVCARLDGIPLALELAAARTRVLSAADIAERLDYQFNLLVSSQNVPARQRTLRNLIDWSYDLLPENERALFRRLSIFAGGWTLKAAEAVCAGDNLESFEVLDLLVHLVDKSLVITDTLEGVNRFRLLETIRQYARERLIESQEENLFARTHAAYFTELAERSSSEMWGRNQGSWLKRLEAENDNLRAALEWMESTAEAHEMMLRMTSGLWRFWRIRGHYQEGRAHLEFALAHNLNAPKNLRAEGLRGAAKLALQLGEYGQATAMTKESLTLFRELENNKGIGRALDVLGEIAYYHGDYSQAVALYTESHAIRTEIGDKEGIADSLRQLGVIARDRGDLQRATELLEQSLILCRELEDKILIAKTLNNLGLVKQQLCFYDCASEYFEEAVLLYRELNDRLGISNTLQNLGSAAKDQGELKQAGTIYEECLKLRQAIGDKRGIAQTLADMAEVGFYQGKYVNTAELADQSLKLFQDLGVKRGIIFTLGLLAYTAQFRGDFERASDLAKECFRLASELKAPRAMAYCKEVLGLIAYARGNFREAGELIQEAIDIFVKVGDRRNVASAKVNLARTAYRLGEPERARNLINESLAFSRELNIRWNLSLGLEILGLLERSQNKDNAALLLFQESLKLSYEQDNLQGIVNCLGAIAGIAAVSHEAFVSATLFAAAQKIRGEIMAGMGSGDQAEYDSYLALARQQLTDEEFKTAQTHGISLTIEQAVELSSRLLLSEETFTIRQFFSPTKSLANLTPRSPE